VRVRTSGQQDVVRSSYRGKKIKKGVGTDSPGKKKSGRCLIVKEVRTEGTRPSLDMKRQHKNEGEMSGSTWKGGFLT